MKTYSLFHLAEDVLLHGLKSLLASDRTTTAELLAHIVAVAEGRLHLSAVGMLAPHLSADNADGLLAAAEHKTKTEIALLLAERFPRPDVPTTVQAVAMTAATGPLTQEPVDALAIQHAPGHVESAPPPRPTVAPLSPGRFDVRFTLDQSAHDLLRYAQALLEHAMPSGDIAEVVKRGLATLVEQLEKRVFAASARPRSQRSARDWSSTMWTP